MTNLLRPETLTDFIGNKNVTRSLEIQLSAAKKRNSPFPHTLFKGDSGCGKTTLSQIIAKMMGGTCYTLNAATLSKKKELLQVISKVKRGDVVFIDEIHRLDITLEELLYPIMEDFKLTWPRKDEIIELDVEPFTLIGATTDSGLLSGPFLNRFKSHNYLESYTEEDMAQIIASNVKRMQINITNEAIEEIARRSKNVPRIANSRLEWIADYKLHFNLSEIDHFKVIEAMDVKGIDNIGLERDDRKYLSKLILGKAIGVQSLVAMTGFSEETIKTTIEPYLLHRDMIRIESRGRVLQPHASPYSTRIDSNDISNVIPKTFDLEDIERTI